MKNYSREKIYNVDQRIEREKERKKERALREGGFKEGLGENGTISMLNKGWQARIMIKWLKYILSIMFLS